MTNDTVLILFNKPAKKEIYLFLHQKKRQPSKKARAGIIDKTNIDDINTHVVSPLFIQSLVTLELSIFHLKKLFSKLFI